MTGKRERSRQEWEREIVARQQNINPVDFPEGLHHARVGGLAKIVSVTRFWIGIVLIAVGLSMLRSTVPLSFAVAIFAGGLCLAITAMRWRSTV